jgi:K+-sensing histidine kinase KdpD
VQKVVQRHGGIIWIEDNPGGGSRLIFTIPRTDPGPRPPVHATPGSNTDQQASQ